MGWDRPLLEQAADMLIPENPGRVLDLAGQWVIVPTRQAARRLRELLARRCHEKACVLLSARIGTPSLLMQSAAANEAHPIVEKAVWTRLLCRMDLSRYEALFPSCPDEISAGWALGMAAMIQRVRTQLVDAGLSVTEAARMMADNAVDVLRWQQLASLEDCYLGELHKQGFQDHCELILSDTGSLSTEVLADHIILAGTPDLSNLLIHKLELLAGQGVDIDVWVAAPDSVSDGFDAWGRPEAAFWNESVLPIHTAGETVFLEADSTAQAQRALRLLQEAFASSGANANPVPAALAAANTDVLDALVSEARDRDIPVYDPNPVPLSSHAAMRLFTLFVNLLADQSYDVFSRIMRHPDWLACLEKKDESLAPGPLLKELDEFQNEVLPRDWPHVCSRLGAMKGRPYGLLKKAVDYIKLQESRFQNQQVAFSVYRFFQQVYGDRVFEVDGIGAELAAVLYETIEALERVGDLLSDTRHALDLLNRQLNEQRAAVSRPEQGLAAEGWVEMLWNPSPVLVITGMNEGSVPASRVMDMFLPDSTRKLLGLEDDARRLARDVYMARTLLEIRKGGGGVVYWLLGKRNHSGDPLKPSRLFFRCSDEALPLRAEMLFAECDTVQESPAKSFATRLNPCPPADVNGYRAGLHSVRVTGFRDYLQCPFRYYLKHVLEMEPLDDLKVELDARDFGTLVHSAWEDFHADEKMKYCDDEYVIAEFLQQALLRQVHSSYGDDLPLPIEFTVHTASQRLRAAASVQAQLVRDGWITLESELKGRLMLSGLKIGGRIDRIDRHESTGDVRVLDYKTSDSGLPPRDTHLGTFRDDSPEFAGQELNGRMKQWTDLQLPLYYTMIKAAGIEAESIQVGYFNMPKAVAETGLYLWEDLSPDMLGRAYECAEIICGRIASREFWPPRKVNARYDDFGFLFRGSSPEDVVDSVAFSEYMKGGRT